MRSLALCILFTLSVAGVSGAESSSRSTGNDVIHQINRARQQPELYATYLESVRANFRGNVLHLPGGTILRTQEGVGAVDEAIRFLHRVRPVGPLTNSPGIAQAAAEHVRDQADGSFGHGGSDFSNPGQRMNRHGTWNTLWGENISYGKRSARDVVLALIVDDGLRTRKHRKNIFNATFNFAGAALGAHARYGTVCSIDFAGGYVEGAATNRSLVARN